MMRADESLRVLRDRPHKSPPGQQFETIENGTAMAQVLPRTSVSETAERVSA
jgi:hypothetical protein